MESDISLLFDLSSFCTFLSILHLTRKHKNGKEHVGRASVKIIHLDVPVAKGQCGARFSPTIGHVREYWHTNQRTVHILAARGKRSNIPQQSSLRTESETNVNASTWISTLNEHLLTLPPSRTSFFPEIALFRPLERIRFGKLLVLSRETGESIMKLSLYHGVLLFSFAEDRIHLST